MRRKCLAPPNIARLASGISGPKRLLPQWGHLVLFPVSFSVMLANPILVHAGIVGYCVLARYYSSSTAAESYLSAIRFALANGTFPAFRYCRLLSSNDASCRCRRYDQLLRTPGSFQDTSPKDIGTCHRKPLLPLLEGEQRSSFVPYCTPRNCSCLLSQVFRTRTSL